MTDRKDTHVVHCAGGYHVLPFGGCFSMENPDTQSGAEKIRKAVEEEGPDTVLDGVKTGGNPPLLGGAKLRCQYGGVIEIVDSGQQEG